MKIQIATSEGVYVSPLRLAQYTHPPLWQIVSGQEDYPTPCPAVVVLKNDPHAFYNKQWQFFVRAINYNLSIQYVTALYGSTKWGFNSGHGFPPCHNYLTGENADGPDPNADKVRAFLLDCLTGYEQGSFLNVCTFNSLEPPPLKDGYSYPQRVEDISIDAYAITPRTHPEMFAVGKDINGRGEVSPFPHGALYDWTGDNDPYTFMPILSNHGYGDVLFPLSKLQPIPDDAPFPGRYRRL